MIGMPSNTTPFCGEATKMTQKRAKNGVLTSKGLKMDQQWLKLEGKKGL